MLLQFCSDPLRPRAPDYSYTEEVAAAHAVGHDIALISFEALVNDHAPDIALRHVLTPATPTSAMYRGWMLTPLDYTALYNTLRARGISLINTSAQYRHCHYLPESYELIAEHTPKTVWMRLGASPVSMSALHDLLRPFGSAPLILKDFVKSRKHDWFTACYIPSAADAARVEQVVRRFSNCKAKTWPRD